MKTNREARENGFTAHSSTDHVYASIVLCCVRDSPYQTNTGACADAPARRATLYETGGLSVPLDGLLSQSGEAWPRAGLPLSAHLH